MEQILLSSFSSILCVDIGSGYLYKIEKEERKRVHASRALCSTFNNASIGGEKSKWTSFFLSSFFDRLIHSS
jgi:hypothetical protein